VFWYEDVLTNEAYRAVNPIPSWLQAGDEPVVVEKLDDTTVVFRFAAPNGLFIQRLATPDGNLPTRFPRHYLEQFHPKYNPEGIDAQIREAGASDWVNLMGLKAGGVPGTPYDARWANPDLPTLYAWTITTGYGEGARVTAERNPYYFKVDPEGNQLPYIDRLVYEQFEDVEVLVLRALAGDIDMQDRHIGTLGNRAVFTDNMERGNYHFFSKVPAFMNAAVIALNLTHKDPVKREIFNNKDFRIGLSYAINRDEINDLVFVGQTEPFQAAPRPESPFYNERMAKQYTEFDLALANEHLDRAGYSQRDAQGYRLGPDGNRISFVVEITAAVNPFWLDIMELVQGYWQEVGIDAQVRNIDRALLYTRKDANEHDAMVWQGDGGLDVVLEPRWYFPFSAESVYAQAWQTWYNNPSGVGSLTDPEEPPAITRRQMELYDQLKATGDPEQQTALMNEILEIAADEFYAIGTVLMPPGYGIVKNNFHNVPESMIDAYLYPHPGPTNPEQYFVESGSQ
nr:ABC transporter substrate-binding protein [Deinococcota bacterium]